MTPIWHREAVTMSLLGLVGLFVLLWAIVASL